MYQGFPGFDQPVALKGQAEKDAFTRTTQKPLDLGLRVVLESRI